MNLKIKNDKKTWLTVTSATIILLSIGFNFYLYWLLNNHNKELNSQLETLESALEINQKKLSKVNYEKEKVEENLVKEKENINIFKNQIENIAGTVNVLERLSKTDEELLKKYSKVYFLNENYIPESLTRIDPAYLLQKDKVVEIKTKVTPYLLNLMEDAKGSGLELLILSGYRSFDTQASLKSSYKVTYGSGANKFSADQGYSEHQLGTTVDFTNAQIGTVLSGFQNTKEYEWLKNNAHKYGFILSYPENNEYYIFEPWHWRYVGTELATKLYEEKISFYSLDQRVLDSYLLNLFN